MKQEKLTCWLGHNNEKNKKYQLVGAPRQKQSGPSAYWRNSEALTLANSFASPPALILPQRSESTAESEMI